MYTKGEIVSLAFDELALAGYEFDISPEEQQTAIRRLDTMMAMWEKRGVRVGYSLPSSPDASDANTASGLPDYAVEAAYLNLAIRLAASYGKALGPDTKTAARNAYEPLLWAAAQPQQQQLPNTLPRGAGNKPWRFGDPYPFFNGPNDDPLTIAQGGSLNILPE